MRTPLIITLAILLFLGGAYLLLLRTDNKAPTSVVTNGKSLEQQLSPEGSLLTAKRKHDLDKIGAVINDITVELDDETKENIKNAKKGFESKENLKELQALLEQSYLDRNSSIKDIKRIQGEIVERKNKLSEAPNNVEKWDPRFVYYLMLQENYTYAEINLIKSLAENGLNMEEVEYINELIREDSFLERIMAFKAKGEVGRAVASFKKDQKKEVDEFIDDVSAGPSIEDKLIEMNYNQSEKEEMIYGNNQ